MEHANIRDVLLRRSAVVKVHSNGGTRDEIVDDANPRGRSAGLARNQANALAQERLGSVVSDSHLNPWVARWVGYCPAQHQASFSVEQITKSVRECCTVDFLLCAIGRSAEPKGERRNQRTKSLRPRNGRAEVECYESWYPKNSGSRSARTTRNYCSVDSCDCSGDCVRSKRV